MKKKMKKKKPAAEVTMPHVAEGYGRVRPNDAERTFSITMAEAVVGDDLSPVANAVDPKTKLSLPKAGEPHPLRDDLVAGEPTIFCVGLRKDGVMIATRSRFFNVRVRYSSTRDSRIANRESDLPEANRGSN